ncbi:hypothetical protein PL373_19050 [Tenacibaculum maritimum]|nr:hypothetical protein [Tenacibaculum maritimum]MDB0603187.1 hypothetical protein [Tenacibaculum maritimum]MDB0610449.1 hypothetical protein [Tenacibaculum maritimum]
MKSNVFKENPKLKSYFQTEDNVKFFTESDAKNHARTLKDKTVTEVKKGASKKDVQLTPMQEAKNRVAAIEKLETVEAVEKALENETAATVKKAGADRIEAIKTAADSSDDKE